MHFITGWSAWHTTNFCFDFNNNTVQHVQTLILSTAWTQALAQDRIRANSGQPNQELCLSFGQNQGATGSTGFSGMTSRESLTSISKVMWPSMPQRPERCAVGHRSMRAQNCIFFAIIDHF